MGTKQREFFTLKGGACDGQKVFLPCYWSNGGWCPPPHCEAIERKPLPAQPITDASPMTETVPIHIYRRQTFKKDNSIWYEFHSLTNPPQQPSQPE